MSSLKSAERGCLLIADISGYTGLLAATELEHAQDALRDLTHTVVGKLRPPFRLAKLEGDAAFVYAVIDRIDGSQLLDTIEATYFAFKRRLESISRATTCPCNACIRIPELELKFIAHHGSFVRQRMYGIEELTGTDVIAVHRLLKNSVAEHFAIGGYALLTDDCLAAAGLDPAPLELREHRETYEHLGEIIGHVHDLETRWRRERELRRVRVSDKQTDAVVEVDLPAAPSVIWEYFAAPALRAQWMPGVARVDEEVAEGRRGVGTTNHCVHGEGVSLEEVLDWRPFDYATIRTTLPGGVLSCVWMQEFAPTETGTRVIIRFERMRRARDRVAWEGGVREMVIGMYRAGFEELFRMLAREARDATSGGND